MDIAQAIQALKDFTKAQPTTTIAEIEAALSGVTSEDSANAIENCGATPEALEAAGVVKELAGQINVVIHALGILRCLPHILEPEEAIESLSLGAGNTGRLFDLETSRRIAEFKFIRWRGGAEAIRQDSLFKDFVALAEHSTNKRKCLYVLGTQHPLAFFRSRRALSSVCSRNQPLRETLLARYPKVQTVQEYFALREAEVELIDVSDFLPELFAVVQ